MSGLNTLLISVTAYSSDGPSLLKSIFQDLQKGMELNAVSSVYKVKGTALSPKQVHDLRTVVTFEGLCAVAQFQTQWEPSEVLAFLMQTELERRKELLHRNVSLNLLMFEDLTYMTPELTLPHPDLHLRPELLIPAAEIWGEKKHPVLNKSLSELSLAYQNQDWGEFFAQGQSLLDF